MARYNLYLMDATRDPRVIRRISALTQIEPGVLARHLQRFPFLVLREAHLSQAVAVRRELERLGLKLNIEKLSPDRITGNSRHPLASQSSGPADSSGTVGTGRDEVVLEAGSGFQELEPEQPSGIPGDERRMGVDERDPEDGKRPLSRRTLIILGLTLLAILLVFAGYHFGKPSGVPLDPRLRAEVEQGLERLLQDTRLALAQGPEVVGSSQELLEDVHRMARIVHSAGTTLPRAMRTQMEELEALAGTLELRTAPRSLVATEFPGFRDFAFPDLNQAATAQGLETLLESPQSPENMTELRGLEFLADAASDAIRIRGLTAQGAQRLEALAEKTRARMEQTRARVLAASLRLRGAAMLAEGEDLRLLVEVPDSTRLEIQLGTDVDEVMVVDGQVLIKGIAPRLSSVSVRLARLDRQPSVVRSILDVGLRLLDPAAYFSTLPGSTLPVGRPLRRGHNTEAVLQTLDLPGGTQVHSRGSFLEASFPPRIEEPRVRDVLLRCAEAYLETRQWPRRVELELDGKQYSLTGMDLWMLSRSGLGQEG